VGFDGHGEEPSKRDVVVDRATGVWARLYAPAAAAGKVPVVVYFHGDGFCVGSTAWSFYHKFRPSFPRGRAAP
jgi:acetyl esterase/lipase